ncbi:hypothetical protein MMC28_007418 [Mycoblastus sanguinarius]|nr:hypothetical protein [Mycoblastus sanguinarius]
MGAPRQKNLIKSRRRVEDDGEEEEGSVAPGGEEDSLSEGSISDADEDADAEASDGSDTDSHARRETRADTMANGYREKLSESVRQAATAPANSPLRTVTNDTEAMMNGLKVSDEVEDQGIAFEDLGKQPGAEPSEEIVSQDQAEGPIADSIGERRRREHEEYKKKRDADPAFVPNRGGFFMHDHRSAVPGQNGFRPFGRGRGRGRGTINGPFPPSRYASRQPLSTFKDSNRSLSGSNAPPLGPADAPWAHDLHETVTQPGSSTAAEQGIPLDSSTQDRQRPMPPVKNQPPNRSFSRTTRIGNVQIRVFLGGMSDPITFSAVPVNQHTRLPHHRPPLRRDKPVRISLPDMPIRYIFPSTERSFIFIPRALRPNQQGFGRIRGRGSFGGGYSVFGGLSSRRTSVYAGSAYSPSVALSRRSSLAREVSAEGLVSPTGPPLNRPTGMSIEPGKPVVRLPPAADQMQLSSQQPSTGVNMAPTVNLPQPSAYPLPQKPTFRENRPAALPMHHPKPERTLQVADIESPATLEFNPPQQQQQLPFHQQVPQIANQTYPLDLSQYPHSRHPSHPSQASGGTPLPQIPERAIHAQPFQSYPYQHPQGFYPQAYPPHVYYYPPADQGVAAPSAAAPAFVPGQPYHYPMPLAPPPQQAAQQAAEPTTQAGTVAHESNGMVYYYDSSQLAAGAENTPPYPPAEYAMPPPGGAVGMGGMMTPPVYYPQPASYPYPPQ